MIMEHTTAVHRYGKVAAAIVAAVSIGCGAGTPGEPDAAPPRAHWKTWWEHVWEPGTQGSAAQSPPGPQGSAAQSPPGPQGSAAQSPPGPHLIESAAAERAQFFCPGLARDLGASDELRAMMLANLADPGERDPHTGRRPSFTDLVEDRLGVIAASGRWNLRPVPVGSAWAGWARDVRNGGASGISRQPISRPSPCPSALVIAAVVAESVVWPEHGPMLHMSWAWRR